MADSNANLLPCPFCGSTATANTHCIEPGWWTCSVNCDGIYDHICSCQMITGGDTEMEAYESAVRAWNTRHVETCEMEYQTDGMMSGWWKCSVCGEAMDTIKACAGREKPKYCGNCGRLVVA